tara:strand:- start:2197 stop:2487 length:291 start_codon:yes stop_codon:yes gene_type:complete
MKAFNRALGAFILLSVTTELRTLRKSISSTIFSSSPSWLCPPMMIALSFYALTIAIKHLGFEIPTVNTFHVFSRKSYISTISVKFPSEVLPPATII